MSIEENLMARSVSNCELCGEKDGLHVHIVAPKSGDDVSECAFVCGTCGDQIEDPEKIEPNHWRCLNESMWSETPAVQVLAWRMLNNLHKEDWAQDLLHMLYLDEETLAWAQAGEDDELEIKHVDSNGVTLAEGDTVTLIKDLNVKGAGFTAKRGTAVRGISLVLNNAEHIEGRVNGQRIVLLTKFLSKSN